MPGGRFGSVAGCVGIAPDIGEFCAGGTAGVGVLPGALGVGTAIDGLAGLEGAADLGAIDVIGEPGVAGVLIEGVAGLAGASAALPAAPAPVAGALSVPEGVVAAPSPESSHAAHPSATMHAAIL